MRSECRKLPLEQSAWTVVAPGNLVYVRGGARELDVEQYLSDKSGEPGNLIRGWPTRGSGTDLYNNTAYANGAVGFQFATSASVSRAQNNASCGNGGAADCTEGSTVDHNTFLE